MKEIKTELLTTSASWRVQLLRIVSMLGLAAAAFGSADFTGVVDFLPQKVAGILIAGGLLAASAKQSLLVIGDVLDDGERNDSFRFGFLALLGCLALLTPACGPIAAELTPDGCILATHTTEGGHVYKSGACVNPATGKFDRVRTEWTNSQGIALRLTYIVAEKRSVVEYRPFPDGPWLEWGAKAGVPLDNRPGMPDAHLASISGA